MTGAKKKCPECDKEFSVSHFRKGMKLHLVKSKSCRTAITSDSQKRDKFRVYLPAKLKGIQILAIALSSIHLNLDLV